jgi:hypothetical protein
VPGTRQEPETFNSHQIIPRMNNETEEYKKELSRVNKKRKSLLAQTNDAEKALDQTVQITRARGCRLPEALQQREEAPHKATQGRGARPPGGTRIPRNSRSHLTGKDCSLMKKLRSKAEIAADVDRALELDG